MVPPLEFFVSWWKDEEERSSQPCATSTPFLECNPGSPRWATLGLVVGLILISGCKTAPKSFLDVANPAPIMRARAVGLGGGLPQSQVIPTLINRLNDPDPVVRLSANEELKRMTGQDFGYVPWADRAERAPSVSKWQSWWARRRPQPGVAVSRRIP